MFLSNVREFMRHYTREFRFALRRKNKARIEAHEAARQRKRIDRRVLHGKELKLLIGTSFAGAQDQLVAKIGKITGNFRIIKVTGVGTNFGHNLQTELPFLTWRNGSLGDIA